ncbi:type 4 pilus major pilin [Sulfitobacter sp. R18_1]|uniref:type 4 pilus major pilin n=1 Tax=Sulfitobacter sp. R18_1 TaxID=2821104 RepID=UPI001ADBCDA3|nr:type 4 pilus major pilin [Sulfitobacter sp. R18_1]MBO9428536.1 prepilin-type N-terminal cleavage/methylation domain-containing protein [Sulfitobacter sp. R18_1]
MLNSVLIKPFAFHRKKKQRGLSLLEAMSVLAIFAFVVAGVMIYLQNAMTNNRQNELMGQVAAIQSTVTSFYAGQSTYTGLNTALISQSDALPAKMIGAGNTIKHSFKDDITVTTGAGNDTYVITANGIPRDACQKIVTMDLGKNMVSMRTSDHAAGVSKQSYTPANAHTQACTSTDVNITWEFY